jgi:hypothetical protein
VVDDAGVLGNVVSADTNEVLESLGGVVVVGATSRDTVNDVLGELRLDTVALRVSVVLATLGADLEPRVHALRNNVRDHRDVNRRVARAGRRGDSRAGGDNRSSGAVGHG